EKLKQMLERTKLTSAKLNDKNSDWSSATGQTYAQLLKRPEIIIEQLVPLLQEVAPEFFARNGSASSERTLGEAEGSSAVFIASEVRNELKSVETEIKYEGYLLQQQRAIERMKKSEQ